METAKRDDGKLLKIFCTCPGVFSRLPHLCGRKKERRSVQRKKEKQILFSPQPPTRGDFHRAVGDKPTCRQPRFLCFPRENYFFLCFSVLRYALLHSTTLSSPNLTYPFLRRQLPTANRFVVGKWLSLGCRLVVIL